MPQQRLEVAGRITVTKYHWELPGDLVKRVRVGKHVVLEVHYEGRDPKGDEARQLRYRVTRGWTTGGPNVVFEGQDHRQVARILSDALDFNLVML